MNRPKVLMACTNYWHSPYQVGSHHLARGFVREGWDVAFVSDPISPLHLVGGWSDELCERFASYRSHGVEDLAGHVWAYTPATLASPHNKPILRSGWIHRNWAKLSLPNVVRMVRERGFGEVDLLYFDSLAQSFWLDAVRHRRSVLRVTDRMVGFKKFTAALHEGERELARRVSAVAYTATQLRDYVHGLGPAAIIDLPNGVNFEHFAAGDRSVPDELATMPRPIAIYVGAMHHWFDFELVNTVARRLPQVSLVLIGPDQLARRRLERLPNLHLLGRRSYARLPSYLHNADVALIPFDVQRYPELVHSVNPLKLYEYFACGLPVIATEWQELQTLSSPALLCRSPEEFVQAVEQVCRGRVDRDVLVSYAERADWRQRTTALLEALGLGRISLEIGTA